MNLNFLKLKKEARANPNDLRKGIRSSYELWALSLYVFIGVVIFGIIIGAWQFYTIYTERNGGDSTNLEGSGNNIDINAINNAVQKREEFISKPFTAPKDPSQL